MHRTLRIQQLKKSAYTIIAIALIIAFSWALFTLIILGYVNKSFLAVELGAKRQEAKDILHYFHSAQVEISDIPPAWRPNKLTKDVRIIEKYTFVISDFSFYFIFDHNDTLIFKIPAYE